VANLNKLKIINGLVFRNKGRGLISTILCIVRGVRPRSSKSVVKQVSLFSFRCYRIAKHSGLKPLWSEFYGKDLSLPVKSQKPKIERGDNLEGLVHHPSPSGSILNFPWVDFIVISTLTFLILEYLYGSPSSGYLVSPFVYDIISEETETNTLEISRVVNSVAVNWLAIGLMSAGAILLSGSIILSYYHGHPWAWLGILEEEINPIPNITIQTTGIQEIGDTVMAGNVMVSGPLSASSLSLVQIRLENQALLDNLAISPIGDLWISPW